MRGPRLEYRPEMRVFARDSLFGPTVIGGSRVERSLRHVIPQPVIPVEGGEQIGSMGVGVQPQADFFLEFTAQGLLCQNCVFYRGPRGCGLVAGDIDPNGICKLWVIPGSLVKE